MENSLKNIIENNVGEREKKANEPDVLGCVPVTQRYLFDGPNQVPGGITKPMTALILIIAVVTICINLGVILRVKKVIMRASDSKPAFFFIGNLAVSDFLVGFYVTIVFCIDLTQFTSEWRNKCCGFLTAVVVTACQETICTIMLITVDKYIAICHGLSYPRIVTPRRVWISIIASWCGSLIIGFLPSFGLHENGWCVCTFLLYINKTFSIILLITAVLLPLVILTFMYSVILNIAIKVTSRKKKRFMNKSTGFRLSLKFKSSSSSKTSNRTLITKISSLETVDLSQPKLGSDKRGKFSRKNTQISNDNSEDSNKPELIEFRQLNDISPTNILGQKTSSLPTVVELHETELTTTYETDSSDESLDEVHDKNSRPSLEENKSLPLRRMSYELANSSSVLSDRVTNSELPTNESHHKGGEESVENGKLIVAGHSSNANIQLDRNNKNSFACNNNHSVESEHRENEENKSKPDGYYRKIITETRDKFHFFQNCRAIKAIFLIIFCFCVTYVPFVTGTVSFKLQNDFNESLFKALNNLLYVAVVLNSLMNPFVYAYGHKEFRIRTKKFKGILAKERKR